MLCLGHSTTMQSLPSLQEGIQSRSAFTGLGYMVWPQDPLHGPTVGLVQYVVPIAACCNHTYLAYVMQHATCRIPNGTSDIERIP